MIEAESPPSEAPEPSRVNRAFAGVGAALGLFVWFNLFAFPLALTSVVLLKSHPRAGLFLGFLAQLCVVAGTIWLARSRWGAAWRKALPLQPVNVGTLAWVALWTLGALLLVLAAYAGLDRAFGLPDIRDPKLVVGGLGVVLGAPLAEEFLFRGYGLARIRELGGARRALLFTALAFALAHSWIQWPVMVLNGLVWGWLVLRTDSLWPALLGHVLNNGTMLVLTSLGPLASLESNQVPWGVILGLGATGLVLLTGLWTARERFVATDEVAQPGAGLLAGDDGDGRG